MAGKTVIGNLVVSLLGDNTKLDKALKGSQKQIKSFTKFGLAAGVMLGNLAAKGIAVLAKAAIQSVKKLAKFTKELVVLGQKSLSLKKSFESLAKAAGASSKKLLMDMKIATRGTIAEVDLLATANRMLLLGLDTAIFGEVMEIARRTAKATGLDINYMVESLSMGLGRQSKMILDNLGIVFQVSEAYDWYAETLGKTSAQLTESEKRLGFQTYAMKIARDNVENLGDDILTLTEVGAVFTTEWEDLRAFIGERLVEAIQAAVKEFGGWEIAMESVHSFIDNTLKPTIEKIIGWISEFIGYLRDADWTAFESAIRDLGDAFGFTGGELEASQEQAQKFVDTLTLGLETIILVMSIFTNTIDALFSSLDYLSRIMLVVFDLFTAWTLGGDEAKEALKRVNANLKIMEKDTKITRTAIKNIINTTKEWKSSLDAIPSKVTTTVETIFKTVGGRPTAGLRAYEFGGIVPSTQAILAHRGEMLLTPRDQKNLFNLIRRPTSQSTTYSTPITIEGDLVVREEADVGKVAEELRERQILAQRGGGYK